MGIVEFFRRRTPIRNAAALADFIDEQSAFLAQKGLYEYSRARAGHYAKVLFGEKTFQVAIEQSRWRAFPLGLALVTELVEGVLNPYAADRDKQLDALHKLTLSVFDRYPVPQSLGEEGLERAAPGTRAPPANDRHACAEAGNRHCLAVG